VTSDDLGELSSQKTFHRQTCNSHSAVTNNVNKRVRETDLNLSKNDATITLKLSKYRHSIRGSDSIVLDTIKGEIHCMLFPGRRKQLGSKKFDDGVGVNMDTARRNSMERTADGW